MKNKWIRGYTKNTKLKILFFSVEIFWTESVVCVFSISTIPFIFHYIYIYIYIVVTHLYIYIYIYIFSSVMFENVFSLRLDTPITGRFSGDVNSTHFFWGYVDTICVIGNKVFIWLKKAYASVQKISPRTDSFITMSVITASRLGTTVADMNLRGHSRRECIKLDGAGGLGGSNHLKLIWLWVSVLFKVCGSKYNFLYIFDNLLAGIYKGLF